MNFWGLNFENKYFSYSLCTLKTSWEQSVNQSKKIENCQCEQLMKACLGKIATTSFKYGNNRKESWEG